MNSLVKTSLILAVIIAGSSAQTSFQCGVPRPGVNRLIVRGSDADPLDWPWHVAVMHKTSRNAPPKYACGGTLIHKNFVITAKHCVQEEGTNNLLSENAIVVRLGVRNLYQVTQGVQEMKIFAIHAFEEEAVESELRHDIAILELRSSVKFNNHVLPACLINRRMSSDEQGAVIGFGLTETDALSSGLKMAQMPVVGPLRCLRSDREGFGGSLHEGHFCAGYLNGTTVCNGDSGGGFFLKQNRTWYLAGIVSFSLANEAGDNRCRHNNYGVFTKVFKYLEWIRRVTGLIDINPPETLESQKLPTEPTCGKRNPVGSLDKLSSNGKAQYGEFPWMIQVRTTPDYPHNEYLCEGSLIHPRVVLTEAECVHSKEPAKLIVRGGEWNAENNDEPHSQQDRSVSEIIVHPKYKSGTMNNNIALLLLTTPFDLQETIQTVCLPPPGTSYDHQRCFGSGWVRKGPGERYHRNHTIVQKVERPIVSYAQCQETLRKNLYGARFVLSDGFICAGGDGSRRVVVVGNEGSPLVCPVQGSQDRYYQAGVLSFRFTVKEGVVVPDWYLGVAPFRPWIDQQMKERQFDTQSYSYQ